jgi:hypothetical protein
LYLFCIFICNCECFICHTNGPHRCSIELVNSLTQSTVKYWYRSI